MLRLFFFFGADKCNATFTSPQGSSNFLVLTTPSFSFLNRYDDRTSVRSGIIAIFQKKKKTIQTLGTKSFKCRHANGCTCEQLPDLFLTLGASLLLMADKGTVTRRSYQALSDLTIRVQCLVRETDAPTTSGYEMMGHRHHLARSPDRGFRVTNVVQQSSREERSKLLNYLTAASGSRTTNGHVHGSPWKLDATK